MFGLIKRTWRAPEPGAAPELAAAIPDLDAAFRVSGDQVSEGTICEVVRIRAGERVFYVKRYHKGGSGLRPVAARASCAVSRSASGMFCVVAMIAGPGSVCFNFSRRTRSSSVSFIH